MPVRESRSINMRRCSPASTASLPTAAKATWDVAGSDSAGDRSQSNRTTQMRYESAHVALGRGAMLTLYFAGTIGCTGRFVGATPRTTPRETASLARRARVVRAGGLGNT